MTALTRPSGRSAGAKRITRELMRNRRRYTDKFRASAVIMLEAQGYPEKKGALASVSNHLKVPPSTLAGWFKSHHNPPPAELRDEKRTDLSALIDGVLPGIFEAMPDAIMDASLKDLATAAGILIDKKQLLGGHPTERTELVDSTSARDRISSAITRLAGRTREEPDNRLPQ